MMRLYVGSQGGTIITPFGYREREILEGNRCFTAAHSYKGAKGDYSSDSTLNVLLDSGAFSDPLFKRLTLEAALERQMKWEKKFSFLMGWDFCSKAIASYDVLIDEKWSGHTRSKARWSVDDAWGAVAETVAAARFLAAHRQQLSPRHLVLGCQGVDAEQYKACVEQVLCFAEAGDWIGLGGWCILGFPRFRHWIGEFLTMLHWCVPLIAGSPVCHIHLYGCLYEPAIAPFAWICNKYGLSCSTDSARPIVNCKKIDPASLKKAGVRHAYWRDNVKWWKSYVEGIERSPFYALPLPQDRQLALL